MCSSDLGVINVFDRPGGNLANLASYHAGGKANDVSN